MATSKLRDAIQSDDAVSVAEILRNDKRLALSSDLIPPKTAIFTDPVTPLMYALMTEASDETLSALIMSGADVINDRWQGGSLLHYVTKENQIDLLVENGLGIDVRNTRGQTPLFSAILRGRPELISGLVRKGADIESRDNEGLTPLLCAIRIGDVYIVTQLISLGSNVYAKTNDGRTLHDMSVERVEYLQGVALSAIRRAVKF